MRKLCKWKIFYISLNIFVNMWRHIILPFSMTWKNWSGKKAWELSKNWIKIKNLTVDVFYFATFLYILFLKLCPTFVVSSLCLLHIYKIWKFSSSTDFESIHSFERSISFNQWWFFKLIVLDDSCEASFKVHLIFFSSQPEIYI